MSYIDPHLLQIKRTHRVEDSETRPMESLTHGPSRVNLYLVIGGPYPPKRRPAGWLNMRLPESCPVVDVMSQPFGAVAKGQIMMKKAIMNLSVTDIVPKGTLL
jgi:hypothetical protein